jgi:hypothetical protein
MLAARPSRWLWLTAAALGCQAAPESWRDQLQPAGPCYEVNLLDGVDSDAELHRTFDCLDRRGHLAPLAPTVATIDRPLEEGTVGRALAAALERLPELEVDVFGVITLLADALRRDAQPVRVGVDLALELATGRPADAVRGGAVDPRDPEVLASGVLVRLAPLLPIVARRLDGDQGPPIRGVVADVLQSPETLRWATTFDAYARSTDPRIQPVIDRFAGELGHALAATGEPSVWTGPTGDSLRDTLDMALTGPTPLLDALAEDVVILLTDARVRARLPRMVESLEAGGHLARVPSQIAWMASVDRSARPLRGQEISALAGFLRLLHDTNRPFTCRASVLGIGVDVDLGNLAVQILRVLSEQDAEFLISTSSILSDVLDAPLTDGALDLLVDTGLCPVLTDQVIDDIGAVETLKRAEAYDLLVAFLEVLQLLRRGEEDHLQRLADVATLVVDRGASDPITELLRDLGPTPLMSDVVALLAPLTNPAAFQIPSDDPVTLDDFIDLLLWVVSPRTDGVPGNGWSLLAPLAEPLLQHDATWGALDAGAALLRDPDTRAHHLLALAPDLLAIDPELTLAADVGAVLRDDPLADALLPVLADGALSSELLTPIPTGDDPRTPIAWAVELATDGTLDDLLHLVDLTLDALGASEEPP